MRSKFRPRVLLAAAVVALPLAGQAQDRSPYLLPAPKASEAIGLHFGRSMPGMTSSSPLAFGPQLGDLFAGGNYQQKTRYSDSDDVSLTAGFGLGNASETIGLEAAFTATSTFSEGVADRLSAAFKVSRIFEYGIAIGFGVEGLGASASDARRSFYGVASKVFDIKPISGMPEGYLSAVTLNIGAGDGRFCRERSISGVPTEVDCAANIFGSIGIRAAEWLGLVADWTGQDLALAASFAPLKKLPIVISPGVTDLVGTAGDGVRFTLGFGMSVKY